jgi:hypothetical protein
MILSTKNNGRITGVELINGDGTRVVRRKRKNIEDDDKRLNQLQHIE